MRQLASGEPDLVLAPSEDRGYYLIGLRRIHRALFDDMPWSTPGVLEETLRWARALHLEVVELTPGYDAGTRADVARRMSELQAEGNQRPVHTQRLLLSMGRIFASGGRA